MSPYVAHEIYPYEMAFRRDGINIDAAFLAERFRILSELYDFCLVELPPSLFSPINEEMMVYDWAHEFGGTVIWVIHPIREQFTQNLAEIRLLLERGIPFHVVLNNASQVTDQDLLFYIWEKIERFSDREVRGMIPYVANVEKDLSKKLEQNVPVLFDSMFSDEGEHP